MENLSIAILDGNLTHDPEMKRLKNDKVVTSFVVAVNHERGSKEEEKKSVSYIPVETWDRMAENCATYLKKGSRVTIRGSIRQDRWNDTDGKNRSIIKILAQSVRFDSFKKEPGGTPEKGDDQAA